MNKMSQRYWVVLAILLLAGCDKAAVEPAQVLDPAIQARPEQIREARLVKGSVICPLEIVNGDSIRQSKSFKTGSRATLVGWSRVADQQQPVPPLVHVVFRSMVPDGSSDLFWPGKRVARPDKAEDNPLLANIGYAATGNFPNNPGKYRVLVWVGDPDLQRECDTGEVFDLHS